MQNQWKKGTAERLILSSVEHQPRRGYDIAKLIESRSAGAMGYHVASLHPLLYRMENRTWIQGRWVERPGQRRGRYYRLTETGRKVLAEQRRNWKQFVDAVSGIAGMGYA